MRRAALALDIALLLMEVAWLSVAGSLLAALLGADRNLVPLWLAVGVGTLGFVATRFFSFETTPVVVARASTVALGFVVLYVAVTLLPGVGLNLAWPLHLADGWETARHMVVGGILVLAFWWSGSRVAQSDAPAQTLNASFRIGVVLVVLGSLAHVVLPGHVGATPAVFLFFGAGVAGFALSHIISMSPDESAGLRDWPRTAGLTVGGILLGSAILAFAAEGRLGRIVAGAAHLGSKVVLPLVALVAWAIAMFVEALTYAILSIVYFFRRDPEPVRFNLTVPNFSNVRPAEGAGSLVPDWLLTGLGWAAVLLAAAGLAFLLWRSLAMRRRARLQTAEEERERLEGEGTLGEDLAEALGSLLARLSPRRKVAPSPLEGLDPADPRSAALGAYYSLLAFAEAQGVARQPSQTPQEFAREVAALYPADDVDFLTGAFQRARYGEVPPSEPDASRLRAAWTALRIAATAKKG